MTYKHFAADGCSQLGSKPGTGTIFMETIVIAQFNIGKIRYPLDDPRMKDFVDNINLVHKVAENIGGLIHRIQDESGNALNIKLYDDPNIVPNLTVWKDVDTLKRFVYNTVHRNFMNRRSEWFLPVAGPKNVMWYVDYIPVMQEGVERLEYLTKFGNSSVAFDFDYLNGMLEVLNDQSNCTI